MNKSKRHHYIPQFLTKNFTDDDGFLFVYNKIENRILSTRQSPKSIFFEMDRNTTKMGGMDLDNIELLYSQLDNSISRDLNNVLLTKQINSKELTSILLLVCQLKWRVPKTDNEFNLLKEVLTQKDLSIKIQIKDKSSQTDEKAVNHIENSEIFKESKRLLLPILPLLNGSNFLEFHNNSFIHHNEHFPSLIGDAPVLERNNRDIRVIEDFVFPLSSYDTFIFKGDTKKNR